MHVDRVYWRGAEETSTVQTMGQFSRKELRGWAGLCSDDMILRCKTVGFGFMKAEEIFLSSMGYPRDRHKTALL